MAIASNVERVGWSADRELVRRAAELDSVAIRRIIKSHNQRLYRLARSVVCNNADAEDVLQETYFRAFNNLASFRGNSSLSTWLSRIALNEAHSRVRQQKRLKRTAPEPGNVEAQIIAFPGNSTDDPERTMAQRQLLQLVERATDELPETFRTVFVARVIEGLSVEERRRCWICSPRPSRPVCIGPAN